MERKGHYILRILLLGIFFSASGLCNSSVKSADLTEFSVKLRVVEQSSRVELGSEKIKITESIPYKQSINIGSALKNYTIIAVARKANMSDKKEYFWIEVRLLDESGVQVAYLTSTTSREKFSVGSGFNIKKDPKNPLVLMIESI